MSYRPLTNEEVHSIKSQIKLLEEERKYLKKTLKIVGSANTLAENEDFIDVFKEYYFKDEAIRLASMLSVKKGRKDVLDALVAIGKTRAWFNSIIGATKELESILEGVNSSLQESTKALNCGIEEYN